MLRQVSLLVRFGRVFGRQNGRQGIGLECSNLISAAVPLHTRQSELLELVRSSCSSLFAQIRLDWSGLVSAHVS
jgi:hypothetical protein